MTDHNNMTLDDYKAYADAWKLEVFYFEHNDVNFVAFADCSMEPTYIGDMDGPEEPSATIEYLYIAGGMDDIWPLISGNHSEQMEKKVAKIYEDEQK